MKLMRVGCRLVVMLAACAAAVVLAGCSLVIPAARIQIGQPLGTVYWGPASEGLSAGVAIERAVANDKKLGSPPYMPRVVLCYKLRNVGDRTIRVLVVPVWNDKGVSRARVRFVSSEGRPRWPEPREAPTPSIVAELAPGEEISEEYHYRIPERPHEMAVRFEYHNYAKAVAVRRDGQGDVVGDLWTGHVESGVLESRIE